MKYPIRKYDDKLIQIYGFQQNNIVNIARNKYSFIKQNRMYRKSKFSCLQSDNHGLHS